MQLPRYALIEYDVNEPEYPLVWALCHDAEGLHGIEVVVA